MQGCATYIQLLQGCVHLAKDDHKVVCTLQRLMQGCHKLAATLQGCRNLEISILVVMHVATYLQMHMYCVYIYIKVTSP